MSRGVDDVDFCAFVVYCRVFGKYGNAAFTLDVVAVHYAFGNHFVCAEDTVLFQQLVHKRRLAVVNVRDNCNVSNVGSLHKYLPFDLSITV